MEGICSPSTEYLIGQSKNVNGWQAIESTIAEECALGPKCTEPACHFQFRMTGSFLRLKRHSRDSGIKGRGISAHRVSKMCVLDFFGRDEGRSGETHCSASIGTLLNRKANGKGAKRISDQT